MGENEKGSHIVWGKMLLAEKIEIQWVETGLKAPLVVFN